MKYFLLLVSTVAAAVAAFRLGSFLCARFVRMQSLKAGRRASLDEALEDPLFLFVGLAAVSGVAAVAFAPWAAIPCLVASAVFARNAPRWIEGRKRAERRARCEQQLDMLCDIVAMGVGAGLSFDAALALYCARFNNELSSLVRSALDQWTHGVVSRSDALEDLAKSVGSEALKRFADTTSRAIEQGAPLAGMLRRLAVELRQGRKTTIERQVAKAPVKMLVPTGVCILPAMLLLVMGPMLLQFMAS